MRAIEYLTDNMAELSTAAFLDGKTHRKALSGDGARLLFFICSRVQEKTNARFYWSAGALAEDTGIETRVVRRFLAGFESLGWITRTGRVFASESGRGSPTPEYVLTLGGLYSVPAETDTAGESDTTGAHGEPISDGTKTQLMTTWSPKNGTKPLQDNENAVLEIRDTKYPIPIPDTPPAGQVIETSQAAWGGKEKAEKKGVESPHLPALLDALVAYEHSNCKTPIRDPRAMEFHWRKEWRDRARAALQQNPTASVTDLVAQLTNTPGRTPGTHSPKVITCGACTGKNRNDDGLTQVPDYDAPETPGRRGRAYKVCPDCAGTGQVKATAVA